MKAARLTQLACALVIVFLGAATGRAASLAYEGFQYPPATPLNGLNGGSGFALPWLADPGVIVQPTALASPLALPSTGFSIGGGFNAARPLATALTQPEYWVSFLIEANPGNDQVWLGLDVGPSPTPLISFGRFLNKYFIKPGGLPIVTAGIASPPGVTDLLVVRVRQSGGGTVVDLWVNTLNFASPPLITVGVPTVAYTWVNLQVQPGFLADEIRIGTTPGDVSAGTLGFGVAGGSLTLTWSQGVLLQAPTPNGPWVTNNASSPYTPPMAAPQQYYRVILQ